MELFPGKQLFLDDFFIESLCDARRVLNRPVKITVEQPLELGNLGARCGDLSEGIGERGWGLTLIHELMDEVSIASTPTGTLVKMLKYR